jgi:hypothetical protein
MAPAAATHPFVTATTSTISMMAISIIRTATTWTSIRSRLARKIPVGARRITAAPATRLGTCMALNADIKRCRMVITLII